MNVTVEWSSEPNSKGYNLNVTSHNPTESGRLRSKPNGVFAPPRQQAGTGYTAGNQSPVEQATANLPKNFDAAIHLQEQCIAGSLMTIYRSKL